MIPYQHASFLQQGQASPSSHTRLAATLAVRRMGFSRSLALYFCWEISNRAFDNISTTMWTYNEQHGAGSTDLMLPDQLGAYSLWRTSTPSGLGEKQRIDILWNTLMSTWVRTTTSCIPWLHRSNIGCHVAEPFSISLIPLEIHIRVKLKPV